MQIGLGNASMSTYYPDLIGPVLQVRFAQAKASAVEIVRDLEREVFLMFGVPESVWSDNGVQFVL